MFRQIIVIFFISLAALLAFFLVVGCAPMAATPRLIAAAQSTPIAVYPTQEVPPSTKMLTVYRLTLELQVDDVQAASGEAMRMNTSYGGYLVTSQNWYENGRSVAFLELAVPNDQAARLHTELLQLGRTTAENYSTTTYDCLYCQPYAHILLYLRSGMVVLPPPPAASGWDPLHTLRAAFNVFVRIFGFLADAVIWVVVVVGPVALLVWAILKLVKTLRKKAS
jgi:hypothetical protein